VSRAPKSSIATVVMPRPTTLRRSTATAPRWTTLGGFALAITLASAAPAQDRAQKPLPETSVRGNARLLYWDGTQSLGQCVLDYGRPQWNPAFDKQMGQDPTRRWRLGQNHWTNLDTNMALTFPTGRERGEVVVPPGHYYLVLWHEPIRTVTPTPGGRAILTFLDPDLIRQARLDASQAHRTIGGIHVVLSHDLDANQPAKELGMRLRVEEPDQGSLEIRFGPHRLRTTFGLDPQAPGVLMPDPGISLPPAARAILEAPDHFEIFATETTPSQGEPDTRFMGYEIRGRHTVTDRRQALEVVGWTYDALTDNSGMAARCFMPRHGILARRGDQEVRLLLCYECMQWQGLGPDGQKLHGLMGTHPKDAMNAFWKARGLSLAK